MPEGPEIRRAADRLERAIGNQTVIEVFFAFDHLKPFARRLERRSIERIETRGKGLLIHFDNRLALYSHNQLYGRWMIRKAHDFPQTGRQLRVAIHTAAHSALLYSASDIAVLTPEEIATHPFLSRLGPDVVSDPSESIAVQVADPRFARRCLGALLLDQHFLAGVGNYLRSEILFVARLHPLMRPADCSGDQLAALCDAAVTLAKRAYRHAGITNDLRLVRVLKSEGQPRSRYRHWVFARKGRPCRQCGTPVSEMTVASRRLYMCPVCQPLQR